MSTVQVLTAERSYEIGLPAGGVAGQVPVKQSADDFDTAWQDIATQLELDNAISAIHANEFRDDLDIYARYGDAKQVGIGAVGPAAQAGVLFGSDVNLYRSSADVLCTQDSLIVGGSYLHLITPGAIFYFGASADVNLYRAGSNELRTDDNLEAVLSVYGATGSASQTQIGGIGPSGASGVLFGSAGDTNLYRYAADTLKTDDSLAVAGILYAAAGLQIPANVQFNVGAAVIENNGVNLDITGGSAAIRILNNAYSAVNMTIYDNGETVVERNDLFGRYNLFARYGGAAQMHMGAAGPGSEAGLTFGIAQDTNLYRSAADTLKTDDSFVASDLLVSVNNSRLGFPDGSGGGHNYLRGNVTFVESAMQFQQSTGIVGMYFGSAGDTNLYRSAANNLTTDDRLNVGDYMVAGGNVFARSGVAAQVAIGDYGPSSEAGMLFGAAADTNLYRSAANTLKTDDNLQADSFVSSNWIVASGLSGAGFFQVPEQSVDPGGVADQARIYAKDNGAGKTQLVVRFGSGAVQVLATEP